MPHSTTGSDYTRSDYSPDRLGAPSPLSTAATSTASTSQPPTNLRHNHSVIRRKPGPHSQPGQWHHLVGITPEETNATSKRSSLYIAQSYTDLLGENTSQNENTPRAMGGNRTSLNMNGGLDQKRRTTSYDEQYQYKENAYGTARERVHRESPVVAELRTNVIIKDEFTLVTDMSYHLAARYSRPDSSIMINVDHSSCLALAGTFEPCYILTISVVPSQMQATTNKRNAALIQSFIADILSVPPERGIIKFVPIPEENYAFNGNTLFGEIERLEQQQLGNGGVKRSITDVRKSMPAFSGKRSSPKLDTEFARRELDHGDGFSGPAEEKQNGVVPAPLTPKPHIPDVFELAGAGTKSSEQRPSTASGTPSSANFAALNGLRLNGVTKEDLEGPDSKTPFGRPKTISGGPVWSSSDDFNLAPRRGSDEGAPSPVVKSEPRNHSKDMRNKPPMPDFTKSNSRSSTPVQKQTPTATMTSTTEKTRTPTMTSTTERTKTPVMTSSLEKTKPAYLENPPKSALAKSHSRSKSKSQSPPEALPQTDDGTAANTAKRRSTANGTSADRSHRVPPPPPVPASKEAKVSKRKSFLSAFRR